MNSKITDGLIGIIAITTVMYTNAAYALGVDLATLMNNFATTVPQLMSLVTAVAYVCGMFLIITGLMELKHFGEQRSMMSHEHSITKPLIRLGVGGALLYLPTAVQVGMSSFWTSPNPYGYEQGGTDAWAELTSNAYMIIQLIGTIAFVRGLLLLSNVGGHHGQQGTFGRAMAHLIGGIFCINISDFVQVIITTLGLGQQ